MPNQSHLTRQFKYDRWANNKVTAVLQDHPLFDTRSKCISYMAHIAGTQQVWYHRIHPSETINPEIQPDYNLVETTQNLTALLKKWQKLISKYSDNIDQIISYSNSKGKPYETPLSDILMHVVIHGQHHRAQIAKVLRNANIKPPITDFIYFSRDQ